MLADLEALDPTLLMFAPDFQVEAAAIKPKAFRPPKDWSRRGELQRLVHDIERQATKPLHRDEIAAEVLNRKGWAHNPDLLETVAEKVKDVRKR